MASNKYPMIGNIDNEFLYSPFQKIYTSPSAAISTLTTIYDITGEGYVADLALSAGHNSVTEIQIVVDGAIVLWLENFSNSSTQAIIGFIQSESLKSSSNSISTNYYYFPTSMSAGAAGWKPEVFVDVTIPTATKIAVTSNRPCVVGQGKIKFKQSLQIKVTSSGTGNTLMFRGGLKT